VIDNRWEEVAAILTVVTVLIGPSLLGMRNMLKTALDKVLAGQKGIEERITRLVSSDDAINQRVATLQREFDRFRVEVANNYIRREDWTNTVTRLTVQMDKMTESFNAMRLELRSNRARPESES
jgi:hypothetical protein